MGLNLKEVNIITYNLKIFVISIFTFYTALKIINVKDDKNKIIITILLNVIISIICSYIKKKTNSMNSIMLVILLLSISFSILQKNSLACSIILISISLSINYVVFALSVIINFLPISIMKINNDYISLFFLVVVYVGLLYLLTKLKRLKNGFSFLNNKLKDEYLGMIILNVSLIVLFTIIMFSKYIQISAGDLGIVFVIMSITMFITIQQSFQTYYKQKLLIKDLEETKKELQQKKEEIEKLEKENLEISKTSHSVSHRQKSLEHKINELILKNETAEEIGLKERINDISKQISEKEIISELTKTNIPEIDDMLKYMQSECIKNKIDFQLQISGNIYSMINNYVSKEELEILLADHIKDAIIAINYAKNNNKSILVRLGLIDGNYGLYIYDTGIEFETETLKNLGKKPITTHKDDGGTGMGFMNTFDTLRKYKASLIIKEIGKPSKDDFTKVIMIKFDNKNEFKIDS